MQIFAKSKKSHGFILRIIPPIGFIYVAKKINVLFKTPFFKSILAYKPLSMIFGPKIQYLFKLIKTANKELSFALPSFLNYFIPFFSLLWYGSPGGILRQVIWKKKKLPMHVWITRWTKIDIFPLVLDARWGRNLLLTAIRALNCASPVNGQHLKGARRARKTFWLPTSILLVG